MVARFDGGRLSSDGGLLLLREIERRLAVAERLAACIEDRRHPGSTLHTRGAHGPDFQVTRRPRTRWRID